MVEAALERVRKALNFPGVTPAGLARRANLHPNSLYSAMTPAWNPSAKTLRALEPVLREIEGEHAAADTSRAQHTSSGTETKISDSDEREVA